MIIYLFFLIFPFFLNAAQNEYQIMAPGRQSQTFVKQDQDGKPWVTKIMAGDSLTKERCFLELAHCCGFGSIVPEFDETTKGYLKTKYISFRSNSSNQEDKQSKSLNQLMLDAYGPIKSETATLDPVIKALKKINILSYQLAIAAVYIFNLGDNHSSNILVYKENGEFFLKLIDYGYSLTGFMNSRMWLNEVFFLDSDSGTVLFSELFSDKIENPETKEILLCSGHKKVPILECVTETINKIDYQKIHAIFKNFNLREKKISKEKYPQYLKEIKQLLIDCNHLSFLFDEFKSLKEEYNNSIKQCQCSNGNCSCKSVKSVYKKFATLETEICFFNRLEILKLKLNTNDTLFENGFGLGINKLWCSFLPPKDDTFKNSNFFFPGMSKIRDKIKNRKIEKQIQCKKNNDVRFYTICFVLFCMSVLGFAGWKLLKTKKAVPS